MFKKSKAGGLSDGPLSESPSRAALRRFLKHKLGLAATLILFLVVVSAVLAPWLAVHNPYAINAPAALQDPSATHWLGTDELGRDILARVLYGGRITLQIALGSIVIALAAGAIIGLISGYLGGWVDALIMRVVDGFLAFPLLILALVIVSVLGPSVTNAMIAVSLVNVPIFARMVRGQVLTLKERTYVDAAKVLGVPQWKVVAKHVWPHAVGTVIVFASLRISFAVLTESALAFLGLGAQLPTATWGSMVSVGTDYLRIGWWYSLFPGLMIFLTVLSLNLIGDALRDALDSRSEGSK